MISQTLLRFLVIGSLTVSLDFVTYQLLLCSIKLNLHLAKTMGFLSGTIFSYVANRTWTFQTPVSVRQTLLPFLILYTLSLGVHVSLNATALQWLQPLPAAPLAAFLLATLVSATLNFWGMKKWIFVVSAVQEVRS